MRMAGGRRHERMAGDRARLRRVVASVTVTLHEGDCLTVIPRLVAEGVVS